MLDWLTAPIDPSRSHEISVIVAWHGRLMVIAWGIMLPLGVFVARYFKIWPRQNWPQQLDHQGWWYSHMLLQWLGAVVAVSGFVLIWWFTTDLAKQEHWHRYFGLASMALLLVQVLGGVLRGTKGGPTDPAPDGSWTGDHYDMSRRRICFEYAHKSLGYLALVCAGAAIVTGMLEVNAARWMWLALFVWWAGLSVAAFTLQRRGHSVDTYQAIWGPDQKHPGNAQKPIGIGIQRDSAQRIGKA